MSVEYVITKKIVDESVKVVTLSFLALSVMILVTIVHCNYMQIYRGVIYMVPIPDNNNGIVNMGNILNAFHLKTYVVSNNDQQQHPHHPQQQEDNNNNKVILAKITGNEAKNILAELEKGNGIYFSVISMDPNSPPVIELIKEEEEKETSV